MNELKKLLYIFQLEGYDAVRFKDWLLKNKTGEITQTKNKLQWSLKAKILYSIAVILDFATFHLITPQALIFSKYIIFIPEWIAKTIIVEYAKFIISTRNDLIVIGITGSYGKTSVKEILSHILAAKYEVLKTPESYNTALGIAMVVIKMLKPSHKVFVVEMGAYQKGDIKALCDLVKPRIGIITAVGKQHLERFKSQEEIAAAKFELVEALPNDGMAFLNIEDKIIYERSKKYPKNIISYYGFCPSGNEKFSLQADSISTQKEGTTFSLKTERGDMKDIKTALLGRHNVLNILVSISVAYYLGVLMEKIVERCKTLSPIPHRLQLLHVASGTTIIDDSFNANPDSARAALEVLTEISSPRKIIITPGLVELGEKQDSENRLFGSEMAKAADYIIVVGETNKEALIGGISAVETQSIASLQYFAVKNLSEATEKLPEIVIPGAVILFENDLPDNYI